MLALNFLEMSKMSRKQTGCGGRRNVQLRAVQRSGQRRLLAQRDGSRGQRVPLGLQLRFLRLCADGPCVRRAAVRGVHQRPAGRCLYGLRHHLSRLPVAMRGRLLPDRKHVHTVPDRNLCTVARSVQKHHQMSSHRHAYCLSGPTELG